MGGLKAFASWGKIALLLETRKAHVYSRILKEGGATDVIFLKSPFERKDIYAGIDVEAIQFQYIFSEPAFITTDQEFRYLVQNYHDPNFHICSYLYVVECLCKVSIRNKKTSLISRDQCKL